MLDRFKYLSRIFQIFGFAPINVTTKDMTNNNKFVDNFVNLIPTTLTTILSISVAYFLIIHPHFGSYGPIHGIINSVSLLSLSLVVISGNGQCFFNRSILRNIIYQIYEIEQKLYTELPIKSTFHIAYRLKILLIFFLFFLSQVLVSYEAYLASASMLSSIFTSTFRFVIPVSILHVVMYSDIMSYFIQQLNRKIKILSTCSHLSGKVELLKDIKVIHMDLWKILTEINRYFGWNLLFIVINSFVYITYQLYWIFIIFQEDSDKLGLIGMCCYKFFFLSRTTTTSS